MISPQIFIVLLFILTLKTDLTGEKLTAAHYDTITCALLLVMVLGFTMLSIGIKFVRQRRSRAQLAATLEQQAKDMEDRSIWSTARLEQQSSENKTERLQLAFRHYLQVHLPPPAIIIAYGYLNTT